MTRRDAINEGAKRLRAAGIDGARLEARLLLAHALGISPEAVLRDQELATQTGPYEALLARRELREPRHDPRPSRILSMEFAVSPATLIPRPESETLIEAARALFAGGGPRRILDLGTGSGCLLMAALREFPQAYGIGIDVVPAAVDLAIRNTAMHKMEGRVVFLCGDWAKAVSGRFDLVFANPPYIATGDLASLMPDVSRYEPQRALDGGKDGLAAYRAILGRLPDLLETSGVAVLELGAGQDEAVSALAIEYGLTTSTHEIWPASPGHRPAKRSATKKPFGRAGRGILRSSLWQGIAVRGRPRALRSAPLPWDATANGCGPATTSKGPSPAADSCRRTQIGPCASQAIIPAGSEKARRNRMNMKPMRAADTDGGGGPGGGGGTGGGAGLDHHGGGIPLNRNHVFDSDGPIFASAAPRSSFLKNISSSAAMRRAAVTG